MELIKFLGALAFLAFLVWHSKAAGKVVGWVLGHTYVWIFRSPVRITGAYIALLLGTLAYFFFQHRVHPDRALMSLIIGPSAVVVWFSVIVTLHRRRRGQQANKSPLDA